MSTIPWDNKYPGSMDGLENRKGMIRVRDM